jgi:hypothetical protein
MRVVEAAAAIGPSLFNRESSGAPPSAKLRVLEADPRPGPHSWSTHDRSCNARAWVRRRHGGRSAHRAKHGAKKYQPSPSAGEARAQIQRAHDRITVFVETSCGQPSALEGLPGSPDDLVSRDWPA